MVSPQWWTCSNASRNAQDFLRLRLLSDTVSLLLVKAGHKASLGWRSTEIDATSRWEKLQVTLGKGLGTRRGKVSRLFRQCTGIPCFIAFCKYCVFCWASLSVPFFQQHLFPLCLCVKIFVIFTTFQPFSLLLYLSWWSVIFDVITITCWRLRCGWHFF